MLGTHINLYYNEELVNDARVQEMSSFPKEGCTRMIDGVMVVKLNEN